MNFQNKRKDSVCLGCRQSGIIIFQLFISFHLLTVPWLELTIAPESRFRVTGNLSLTGLDNTSGNLIYKYTLWYRFFDSIHRLGDFAGFGFGVKNNYLGLTKENERDKAYEIYSHALFGILDLSFLQISGGYIYSSFELFDRDIKRNTGSGFFVSVMAGYQF